MTRVCYWKRMANGTSKQVTEKTWLYSQTKKGTCLGDWAVSILGLEKTDTRLQRSAEVRRHVTWQLTARTRSAMRQKSRHCVLAKSMMTDNNLLWLGSLTCPTYCDLMWFYVHPSFRIMVAFMVHRPSIMPMLQARHGKSWPSAN